jgi:hypothetical protein
MIVIFSPFSDDITDFNFQFVPAKQPHGRSAGQLSFSTGGVGLGGLVPGAFSSSLHPKNAKRHRKNAIKKMLFFILKFLV